MRKSLWITLTVLLVAICAPNAHAQTYTPDFTCIGTCVSLPTAPNVSFPSPTAINVTWDTISFPTITLLPPDLSGDSYGWFAQTDPSRGLDFFTILDITTGDEQGSSAPALEVVGLDHGPLAFSAGATPEPGTAVLWLTGIGLVFLMRKQLAPAFR